jgi:hypothetical protein
MFLQIFIPTCQIAQCHNPEDHDMNFDHHDNLKTRNPEDGGSRFLQNVDTHVPDYIVSLPRRPLPWKPQIF